MYQWDFSFLWAYRQILVLGLSWTVALTIGLIVLGLLIETKVPGRAIQIAGNNIPAEAAFGQMVQGRGSPRKRIGMFIGECTSYPEAEMICDRRHSRHQQERIIHWDLDPALNGRIGFALIYVIRTKDICEKQTVELSALQ